MTVPPTIDNTLGLLFNVAIITAALYGAGLLQGWYYFRKYNSHDVLGVRLLIAFVLICDTVQETLICEAVYKYTVTMHGDPESRTRMVKTILIELFFSGAIGFSVQQFYCYRIYRVSSNIPLAALISLGSFSAFACLYVYAFITLSYPSLSDLVKQQGLATALNVTSAATDIAITMSMVWCLHIKKTGYKSNIDKINWLIIFTFNTGILTSIFSLIDTILLNTIPETWVYMGFFLIRDRFYTNSILVTLNSRQYLQDSIENKLHTEPTSFSLGRMTPTTTVDSRIEGQMHKSILEIDDALGREAANDASTSKTTYSISKLSSRRGA